jgi:hypothetical protein
VQKWGSWDSGSWACPWRAASWRRAMNSWSTIAPEIRRNSSWRGASVADSPREVAENSDIIITMLPGPPEVEEWSPAKPACWRGQ